MPFQSKAQMRKFGAMASRGEISQATFKEWREATPSVKDLPERKNPIREEIKRRAKKNRLS